jgi:hypothetical protein
MLSWRAHDWSCPDLLRVSLFVFFTSFDSAFYGFLARREVREEVTMYACATHAWQLTRFDLNKEVRLQKDYLRCFSLIDQIL